MVCIYCSGKTKVINSRPQKRLAQTWRRRECLDCGAVFTTLEAVDYAGSLRVRAADGHLEPFTRDKLFVSLYKALGHRKTATADASALADTIIAKLRPNVHSGLLERNDIVTIATGVLKNFDEAATVQYAAYHKG
jgi:transcriptional repressor NrdR